MWTLVAIRFAPFFLTASTIYTVAQYPVRNEADINNMFLIGAVLCVGYFVAFRKAAKMYSRRMDLFEEAIRHKIEIERETDSLLSKLFNV